MTEALLVKSPITDLRVEPLLQPEPQHERFWCRRWSPRDPVRIRGVEHLIVLLASLGRTGDYAGIINEATGAWAQVKRLGDRWWVEGRSASEGWRLSAPGGDDA